MQQGDHAPRTRHKSTAGGESRYFSASDFDPGCGGEKFIWPMDAKVILSHSSSVINVPLAILRHWFYQSLAFALDADSIDYNKPKTPRHIS
jgi:hypothetical protein